MGAKVTFTERSKEITKDNSSVNTVVNVTHDDGLVVDGLSPHAEVLLKSLLCHGLFATSGAQPVAYITPEYLDELFECYEFPNNHYGAIHLRLKEWFDEGVICGIYVYVADPVLQTLTDASSLSIDNRIISLRNYDILAKLAVPVHNLNDIDAIEESIERYGCCYVKHSLLEYSYYTQYVGTTIAITDTIKIVFIESTLLNEICINWMAVPHDGTGKFITLQEAEKKLSSICGDKAWKKNPPILRRELNGWAIYSLHDSFIKMAQEFLRHPEFGMREAGNMFSIRAYHALGGGKLHAIKLIEYVIGLRRKMRLVPSWNYYIDIKGLYESSDYKNISKQRRARMKPEHREILEYNHKLLRNEYVVCSRLVKQHNITEKKTDA